MSSLSRAALLSAPTVTAVVNGANSDNIALTHASVVGAASYVYYEDGVVFTPDSTSGTSSITANRGSRTRGTSYSLQVAVVDSAGREGPKSTAVVANVPPAAVAGAWPRRAAYQQQTTTFPSSATELANRAVNDWIVVTNQPGTSATLLAQHVAGIKAQNPNCKVFAYTNTTEVNATNAVWADLKAIVDARNWWARSSYPAGPINVITQQAVNETLQRTDANGLYWVERLMKYWLDDFGLDNAGLDGFMSDNSRAITAAGTFDWDENGSTSGNGSSTTASRNAHIAALRRRRDYLTGRGYLTCVNGVKNWIISYWKDGNDDRAALMGSGDTNNLPVAEYGIIEVPIGNQFADEGYYFTSAGVLTYAGFGAFSKPTSFGTSSPGLLEIFQVSSAMWADHSPEKLVVQNRGPSPSKIGVWTDADKHIRYCFATVHCLTDHSYHYIAQDVNPLGQFQRIDELEEDWGAAVDPLQCNAGAWRQGVYKREFQNGVLLLNPSGNGTQTVTAPTGSWRRVRASDHFNQAPLVNTGAAVGSTITLADRDALYLVRVP